MIFYFILGTPISYGYTKNVYTAVYPLIDTHNERNNKIFGEIINVLSFGKYMETVLFIRFQILC